MCVSIFMCVLHVSCYTARLEVPRGKYISDEVGIPGHINGLFGCLDGREMLSCNMGASVASVYMDKTRGVQYTDIPLGIYI